MEKEKEMINWIGLKRRTVVQALLDVVEKEIDRFLQTIRDENPAIADHFRSVGGYTAYGEKLKRSIQTAVQALYKTWCRLRWGRLTDAERQELRDQEREANFRHSISIEIFARMRELENRNPSIRKER